MNRRTICRTGPYFNPVVRIWHADPPIIAVQRRIMAKTAIRSTNRVVCLPSIAHLTIEDCFVKTMIATFEKLCKPKKEQSPLMD